MNKLTIPVILVATVMVAGIFAFIPVQEASTVHLSAAGAATQLKVVTAAAVDGVELDTAPSTTLTCPGGCLVNGITLTFVNGADEELNIAVNSILVDGEAINTVIFDMVAGTDLTDVNIFTSIVTTLNVVDTETPLPIVVENDLVIPWLDIAGTWGAADTLTVKFLIEVGADTTATAVTT